MSEALKQHHETIRFAVTLPKYSSALALACSWILFFWFELEFLLVIQLKYDLLFRIYSQFHPIDFRNTVVFKHGPCKLHRQVNNYQHYLYNYYRTWQNIGIWIYKVNCVLVVDLKLIQHALSLVVHHLQTTTVILFCSQPFWDACLSIKTYSSRFVCFCIFFISFRIKYCFTSTHHLSWI
jgi:hypothetical protein